MKKRLFSMFLVLAMVFTMLPLSALAEENGTEAVTQPEMAENCPESETPSEEEQTETEADAVSLMGTTASGKCGKDMTWSFSEDGTLTISGSGRMTDYSSSFPWKDFAVKTLIIEEGVTALAPYAFDGCRMTSLTVPSTISLIDNAAFANCENLTDLTLSEGLTWICDHAFYACTSLTSIAIPSTVGAIYKYAFAECSNLSTVYFPYGISSVPNIVYIGDFAFMGCSLTDIYYAGSEEDFNRITFPSDQAWNKALLKANQHFCVTLGGSCGTSAVWELSRDGVLTISGSGNLTNYSTPLETPWGALRSYIKEVRVSGVTSTGANTFSGCKNLIFAMLSDGVTYTGHHAFSQCTALTAVFVPAGFDTVGVSSFEGCSSLNNILHSGSDGDWNVFVNSGNTPFSDAERINNTTAAGRCGDSAVWYRSGNALCISGKGKMWDYASSFGTPWNSFRSDITDITIKNGISEIGSWCFSDCSNLTSVTIYNSVTAIKDSAFFSCSSLTSVAIPKKVTSIGKYAFSQCSQLSSVTIPSRVTEIGDGAFYSCYALTSLTIPSSISYISPYTFYYCTGLTNITLPSSLTGIDQKAFGSCTALKYVYYSGTSTDWQDIDIEAGNEPLISAMKYLKALDGGAFGSDLRWLLTTDNVLNIYGTGAMPNFTSASSTPPWYSQRNNIRSLMIQNGITSIGNYAFINCAALTSVSMPESIKSIGKFAFMSCTALTSASFPSGVSTIDQWAFAACSQMTDITVPHTLITIGSYAFYGCDSLTDVTYSGIASEWNTLASEYDGNDSLLSATLHCWLDYGFCGNNCEYILDSNGVLTISGSGDMGDYYSSYPEWHSIRSDINSIVIKAGVTGIGAYSFDGCKWATSVFVSPTVTSIGEGAFGNLDKLSYVIIPSAVTTIEDYAFFSDNNPDLILYGESGSAAEAYASRFGNTFLPGGSCGNEVYWKLDGSMLTILGSGDMKNFNYTAKTDTVLTPWQKSSGSIQSVVIQPGVTSIGTAAFYKFTRLSSVTIPDSVTSIGNRAFGKSAISSAALPNSLMAIGTLAFTNCSKLLSVTIPEGLTSIASNAFNACSALSAITVSPENQNYSSYDGLLYNKTQTELLCCPTGKTGSMVLSPNLTVIGETAFGNCSRITTMMIPEGATTISPTAFQNCTGLTVITIPSTVTNIGSGAFSGCSGLTDVYFTGSQSEWNSIHIDDSSDGNISLHNATKHYNSASGYCTDSITWTLDSSGLLTISGTGALPDYDYMNGAVSPFFSLREKIKKVVINNGITRIGNETFDRGVSDYISLFNISSVSIPASVTSIGDYAFHCTRQLTALTIPNSVESIGKYAFYDCDLHSVEIPASVKTIGEGVFLANTNLSAIRVAESNPCYCSIDGILYSKDRTQLIFVPAAKGGSVTVPSGTTTIDLLSSSKVVSYSLPSSVTYINFFKKIGSLTDIYYGGSESDWKAITKVIFDHLVDKFTIHYNVLGAGTCGANATWTVTSSGMLTVSGTGGIAAYESETDVPWYSLRNDITEIKINDGITAIGMNAFSSLSKAAYVSLASSVTKIGSYAFRNCESLSVINIPKDVTQIGEHAFTGCNSLEYLNANPSSTTYSSVSGVLYDKGKTTLLLVPNGISSLSSLPSSVTSIGANAAEGCRKLTSITIPAGVKSIGDSAFLDCAALKDVYYDGTKSEWETITIGSGNSCLTNALLHCSDDADLKWALDANGVLTISGTGDYDYTYLTAPWASERDNIKAIVIESGITNIPTNAFANCKSVVSVSIPGSVTSIGESAFYSSTALESITVDADNGYYASIDGILYTKDLKTLIKCPENKSGAVEIPSSTETIQSMAFFNCQNITSLSLPTSLKAIGEFAFCYCSRLSFIDIPYSLGIISSGAFYECSSLKSIVIPKSVGHISTGAFKACEALTDVYYLGTTSKWDTIIVSTGNSCLTDAAVYCLFDCDVNANNNLDLKDVSLLFQWWNGKAIDATAAANVPHCDLNKDLTVDLRDIALLYNIIITLTR